MLRVYMGEGVGKTTAAAGLCLRAAAHGKQVRVLQLLKPAVSPEYMILQQQNAKVTVTAANEGIPFIWTLSETEKQERAPETERAAKDFFTLQEGDFLLIADEMGGALENGMLSAETLAELLASLPETVHAVLTGRHFPQEILALADCISEIRCVRHPYDKGVSAVEGLEY